MLTTHLEHFFENFKNVISQVEANTHTIILSSEGIYNFWWDFPDESKEVLAELSELFETEVWVWFREPLAFIESYYKQCLRNPWLEGNPCYGQDFSFAEMLEIEWFSRHLDYRGFVTECQALFGGVLVFEYQGDVVQEVVRKLGLATPHDNPTPRRNRSLNSTSIELLRTINQNGIKAKDKERLMPHLKKINEILEPYPSSTLIDDDSKKRVLRLFRAVEI